MTIWSKNFSCREDFDKVNRFLSDTYIINQRIDNWGNARWSFNRFCIHNQDEKSSQYSWEKGARIWFDDNKIAGVCHYEEPDDYFIQIHPEYKYLEEEMLFWVASNAKAIDNSRTHINVACHEEDTQRISLFEKHGSRKLGFSDIHRQLILTSKIDLPELNQNFRVRKLDPDDPLSCSGVAELYSKVWPDSMYMPNGATVSHFERSPSFNRALSYIMLNESGVYIAFFILWHDTYKKHAHLYPFTVDQRYQKTKVPDYILALGINQLIDSGYETLTLSAFYSEHEEKLFSRYGFINTGRGDIYSVPIDGILG